MHLSQPFTRFLAASCAFSCTALLLSGGPAHAQAADSPADSQVADTIDYLYVSPQGSDACSGQSPVPAGNGSGPFQTLAHTQDIVGALTGAGLSRPVEVSVDPAVCPAQDFLGRWFPATPTTPVIWHADAGRTVLIYTPSMSQQIDALAAEDFAGAAGPHLTRFYVSPDGNDAWQGISPALNTGSGPFRTLEHAQEAVTAFLADNPGASVEVVFESEPAVFAAKPKAAVRPKVTVQTTAKAQTTANAAASSTYQPSALLPHSAPASAPAIIFGRGYHNGNPIGIKGSPIVSRTPPKMVFAHFMVAARDYGGSVAGYERDIQDAQAAGLDGFALNCGAWNGAEYKNDTAHIFQAAAALNSGFKLFFSADMTGGLSPAEIQDMIKTYGNNPYYFCYNGRPVLSTWGGEGNGAGFWKDAILTPLRQAGYNVYFVPRFYTRENGNDVETPNVGQAKADYRYAEWKSYIDGMFTINGLAMNNDVTAPNVSSAEAYAASLHSDGHTVMSSVSPQYWGSRQVYIGRRYFEYSGGEGLARQWESIINVQKSDWVEMFTWNDFEEATYFSPIDDLNKYWPYLQHPARGFYKCHAGILKLNQHYIKWFKAGAKPVPTSDSLYFAYRTQPKNVNPTNERIGPVNWFIGDIQDDIYVTTILTAPATLVVTTGPKTLTYPVPAGLFNTRVPFQTGAQSFQLLRGGKTLLTQAGDPIEATPAELNFIYTTGWASD